MKIKMLVDVSVKGKHSLQANSVAYLDTKDAEKLIADGKAKRVTTEEIEQPKKKVVKKSK